LAVVMHPTVLKSARHCNKQVSAYAALPGDIYSRLVATFIY